MTEEEKLEHKRAVKRECNRRWMERHREQQRECVKRWADAHKEHRKEVRNKWRRENHLCQDKPYLDPAFSWEDVEGFDGWSHNIEVHHRLEMFGFSRDELKEQGRYFYCTPDELVCMTNSEHTSLHHYLRAIAKKNP